MINYVFRNDCITKPCWFASTALPEKLYKKYIVKEISLYRDVDVTLWLRSKILNIMISIALHTYIEQEIHKIKLFFIFMPDILIEWVTLLLCA